jgi:hypothetical protein
MTVCNQEPVEVQSMPEMPKFSIDWIRFPKHPCADLGVAFTKPKAFVSYGGTGEGKSNIVENISNRYSTVIDAFGSRDNEGLGWCRSHRKDSILFLHGDNVKIDSNWDDITISEFRKTPIEKLGKYKVILSVAKFYVDIREEWYSLVKVMDKLWERESWTEPWCLAVREAANLLYSRESIGESQTQAKNYIIYVIREMRHCGFALALDSIRWFSIDTDIRTIADYTILKGQGIEGLPKTLHFLYNFFDPYDVMQMKVQAFVIVSRKGPIGHGTSTLAYWHKQESENLVEQLGINVQKGERVDFGRQSAHMGDYGHANIVRVRHEFGLSFGKIAEKLKVSDRTTYKHVLRHNEMVRNSGECPLCARVNGPYAKTIVA